MPPLDDAASIATLWEHTSAALADLHELGFAHGDVKLADLHELGFAHGDVKLADLHELGFAHGDVKPANVCVNGSGAFFLVGLDSAARSGTATQTTLEYLPVDERGARARASARADWWALAMTLTEKACGNRPGRGRSGRSRRPPRRAPSARPHRPL